VGVRLDDLLDEAAQAGVMLMPARTMLVPTRTVIVPTESVRVPVVIAVVVAPGPVIVVT
jgi:hypothetical protein